MKGYTVLELLFVIVLIAIMLVFSLSRYARYLASTQNQLIKNDILTLQMALQDYFHEVGCNASGEFMGRLNPDLQADLHLNARDQNRLPNIVNYSAYITKKAIQTDYQKPLYNLGIIAQFNTNLSNLSLDEYAKTLGATGQTGHELFWEISPLQSLLLPQGLWIMRFSRDLFRQQENQKLEGAHFHAYSYCAQ